MDDASTVITAPDIRAAVAVQYEMIDGNKGIRVDFCGVRMRKSVSNLQLDRVRHSCQITQFRGVRLGGSRPGDREQRPRLFSRMEL